MEQIDVKGSLQSINQVLMQLLSRVDNLYSDISIILDYQSKIETSRLSSDTKVDTIVSSDYLFGAKGNILNAASALKKTQECVRMSLKLL